MQNSTCSTAIPYSGQICTDALTSLQLCFSGDVFLTPVVNIPLSINQQQGENDTTAILTHLILQNTTEECSESMLLFICFYIFELCDVDGHHHVAPRDKCLKVRDDSCSKEWKKAMSLLPGILPECEDLSDGSDECAGRVQVTSVLWLWFHWNVRVLYDLANQ